MCTVLYAFRFRVLVGSEGIVEHHLPSIAPLGLSLHQVQDRMRNEIKFGNKFLT